MFALLLISLLITTPSFASDTIPNESEWLLLGIELGHQEKDTVSSPEITNSGYKLGISAAYSKYKASYLWDLNFGFRFDKMENKGVRVETKSLFAGAAARYRLDDRWSVGPELQLLIGKDVSFSDTGTNSDDRSYAFFAGARVMYDIYEKKERDENILRLGIRAMTDLDISDRNISSIEFLAEYAWPIRKAKKMIGIKKKPALKFNLRNANINFVTGSKELKKESVGTVIKLAKILNEHDSEWEYIDISGHSDSTGSYKNNVKLSWDRADFVRMKLIENGVSERRIDTKGFGPDKPIDKAKTAAAYKLNRRVELELISDTATPLFVKKMELLFGE